MNKEEIEKAKEVFNSYIRAIDTFGTIDPKCINNLYTPIKTLSQYIQELETEKQKLIDILERENEEDAESVKRYEKMRRNTTSEFYKKSFQTNIHKLNAKRETRRNILKIMKGEK